MGRHIAIGFIVLQSWIYIVNGYVKDLDIPNDEIDISCSNGFINITTIFPKDEHLQGVLEEKCNGKQTCEDQSLQSGSFQTDEFKLYYSCLRGIVQTFSSKENIIPVDLYCPEGDIFQINQIKCNKGVNKETCRCELPSASSNQLCKGTGTCHFNIELDCNNTMNNSDITGEMNDEYAVELQSICYRAKTICEEEDSDEKIHLNCDPGYIITSVTKINNTRISCLDTCIKLKDTDEECEGESSSCKAEIKDRSSCRQQIHGLSWSCNSKLGILDFCPTVNITSTSLHSGVIKRNTSLLGGIKRCQCDINSNDRNLIVNSLPQNNPGVVIDGNGKTRSVSFEKHQDQEFDLKVGFGVSEDKQLTIKCFSEVDEMYWQTSSDAKVTRSSINPNATVTRSSIGPDARVTKSNTGVLSGIAIVAIVLICVLIVVGVLLYRRRKKTKSEDENGAGQEMTDNNGQVRENQNMEDMYAQVNKKPKGHNVADLYAKVDPKTKKKKQQSYPAGDASNENTYDYAVVENRLEPSNGTAAQRFTGGNPNQNSETDYTTVSDNLIYESTDDSLGVPLKVTDPQVNAMESEYSTMADNALYQSTNVDAKPTEDDFVTLEENTIYGT